MQKTNHAAIGAFVVGAIALTIACIMLFGSGGFFETNITYTLSFDKSVKGLAKGAPVMFRGIKIGEVTDIKLSFDNNADTPQEKHPEFMVSWPITVTINLFPYSVAFEENRNAGWLERMLRKFYPQKARETMEGWLKDMILKKGLRGQLQSQNLLTGLLYIELDLFYQEKSCEEIAALVEQHVIPTRMSAIERLYLSLNQNNFTTQINHFFDIMNSLGGIFNKGKAEELIGNVISVTRKADVTLTSLNKMIKDIQTQSSQTIVKDATAIFSSVRRSVEELEGVLKKLNQPRTNMILDQTAESITKLLATVDILQKKLPGLVDNANQSITQLTPKVDATLTDARHLMSTLDDTAQKVANPLQQLNDTLKKLDIAATEGSRLLKQARLTLAPNSPLLQDLTRAVNSTQQAAQSVKSLADLLTDTPEVLIRGRNED